MRSPGATALGGLVLAVTAYAVAPRWVSDPLLATVNALVPAVFVAAAAALAGAHEQRGNARLCLATAAVWACSLVGTHPVGPLPVISVLAGAAVFVPLAPLLLRYPRPALTRPADRLLAAAIAGWSTVVPLLWVVTSSPAAQGFPPGVWWPRVGVGEGVGDAVGSVFEAGAAVLAVAFVLAVAARVVRGRGLDRRLLAPVLVAAVGSGVAAAAEVAARMVPDDSGVLAVVVVAEGVAVLAVPGSFVVSGLRRRLHRGAIAELALHLRGPQSPETVRDRLRATLRDPSVELLFWLPEDGRHVDVSGHDAGDGAARDAVPIVAADGAEVGLLVVEGSLRAHASLLDAAVSVAALSLEHGRLLARVRAGAAEVRAARERLAEAGADERRRVERDLHDGVQQRLLALKLTLATAGLAARSAGEDALLDDAQHELGSALEELRAVTRGVGPARLVRHGLVGALREVVASLPIKVDLDLDLDVARRWEPAVETAAYYLVCEALNNVVKHAGAGRVAVRVRHTDGHLDLDVTDDGRGGAAVVSGGGLVGLRERVTAAGGEFGVRSGAGAGTAVSMSIPCG